MAIEAPGAYAYTFEAGADLRTGQFTFVKLNSSAQVVAIAATTDKPIGILQNKPNTGEAATVVMSGISKLKMSAAVAAAAVVGPSANGRGVAASAYPVGHCIVAVANADEIGSVAFNCTIPWQTAIT